MTRRLVTVKLSSEKSHIKYLLLRYHKTTGTECKFIRQITDELFSGKLLSTDIHFSENSAPALKF